MCLDFSTRRVHALTLASALCVELGASVHRVQLLCAGDHKLAKAMGSFLLLTSKARCIFVRELGTSWGDAPGGSSQRGVVPQMDTLVRESAQSEQTRPVPLGS